MERSKPLQGKRIIVVGGLDRVRRFYREEIESLGGEVEFVAADNDSTPANFRRCDFIVIVAAGNQHKVTARIEKQTKDRERFVYVNSLGKGAIRTALLSKMGGAS